MRFTTFTHNVTIAVIASLFSVPIVNAQSWSVVGAADFSSGNASGAQLALDPNGTPYVVYIDGAYSGKATVMKFNGSGWVAVGTPGFTAGIAGFTSIAINNYGTPYVTYQDGANSERITVMRFNGTNWVNVGSPGFSSDTAQYTRIAIDTGGVPYVAYEDGTGTGSTGHINVMKFNGTSWTAVGSADFSAGSIYGASITFDKNDTPYVAYGDVAASWRATVMKFNGSSWINVGSPGFSAGEVAGVNIQTGPSGTPYVTYQDLSVPTFGATVMRFNGASWVVVGSPGFTPGDAGFPTIAINAHDTPYVAFMDYTDSNATSVMEFNGTDWVYVGGPDFSALHTNYPSLAIDKNGILYLAYSDHWTTIPYLTVMKYATPALAVPNLVQLANDVRLFPNPAHGSFVLNVVAIQQGNVAVSVTNFAGEKVKELTVAANQDTEIQLNMHPGIYFVAVAAKGGIITKQLVIE